MSPVPEPIPLDLDSIRARLEQTESTFWENGCRESEDMCTADLAFIAHAPTDIAALIREVEGLRAGYTAAYERIHDLEQSPIYSIRARVDRFAPTAGPNGAPVGFSWKVGWIMDELFRTRAELEQLRTNPATNTGDKP